MNKLEPTLNIAVQELIASVDILNKRIGFLENIRRQYSPDKYQHMCERLNDMKIGEIVLATLTKSRDSLNECIELVSQLVS